VTVLDPLPGTVLSPVSRGAGRIRAKKPHSRRCFAII